MTTGGLGNDGAIPIKAKPLEVFEGGGGGARFVTGVIKVFNAHEDTAAEGAGAEPGNHKSTDIAKM